MLIAVVALAGWWINHAALAAWLPAIDNMTFNTACSFFLLGLACQISITAQNHRQRDSAHRQSNRASVMIAAAIAGIAAMSLIQDMFAVNLGIDNLLFDSRAYHLSSPYPGRMSSITSGGFLFTSLALLCLSLQRRLPHINTATHALILLVALVGMTGIGMHFLMGQAPAQFAHLASISAMTAVAFLLLAAAMLQLFHQRYSDDGYPLLYAGIRLMFRLKYPQKFAIISIVFAMPLLLLVWNELDSLEHHIEQAQLKITGITHLHQTIDLLNAIPRHRGMLNAHLADKTLFVQELQHSSAEIDRLFQANDVMDQQHRHDIAIPKNWADIEQRWRRIKQTSPDALLAWQLHTEIINLLHQHLRAVSTSTQLTYDAEPTVHNLVSTQVDVLPRLFEGIGQLRGQGAAIIASGSIERRQQLLLASDISRTNLLLDEYRQLIDAIWTEPRNAPDALRKQNRAFMDGCRNFLDMAESQLVEQPSFTVISRQYFNQATQALDAGFAFNHASLVYVQQLLQQRITRSINRQYMIKLSILLAALLLLYLFSAFYQSMMHTIKMFNRAVEDFGKGGNNELALLPARDEMILAFNAISSELMRTHAHISAIVDYAVDGIVTIDANGVIQSFNPAAEQQFGYSADDIIGENITMLMPQRYRQAHIRGLRHFAVSARNNMIGSGLESHGLRKDASEFPLHLSVSTMKLDGERSFIGIIRDITRHNELEQALRQAHKMEAIGVLVGGVAHNFNNMLAGIIGQAYLAKMRSKDHRRIIKHLDSIEEISMQASDMVKQLLTFAHKDFMRHTLDISLSMLIRESLKTARLDIPADITLDLQITDADLMVHGDASQIQQMLINIVNNACDAVADSRSKRISVGLQPYQPDADFFRRHPELVPGPYAALHISDSGHGMDSETLDHIFEPFFTLKDVDSGAGLGLSAAFGCISAHHGVIEVESQPDPEQPGHGSVFHIYLPLTQAASPAQKQAPPDVHTSLHGETLLLVDDEKSILNTIRKVLEQLGYHVITACDGQQGLQCFLKHQDKIRAIITDVVMPGAGGIAMSHKIRAIDKTMPVIFLTAFDQGRVSLSEDEALFSCVLSKPIKIAELSQQIRTILEKAGQRC
ncbi:MAG: PAS domain S-box protein [Mariprofundaceae bacterium]